MSRKKLKINKDVCIGCGSCAAVYPDDFMITDDGLAETITNEGEEEAMDSCPVGAIEEE